jgi:hypothetical protein
MEAAPVAKRADERLGEAGCAALRIAYSAAHAMEERGCARGIVDALMLERLRGSGGTLSLGELRSRLPERYQRRGPASAAAAAVAALLQALAERTGGVIAFDGREAKFNPRAAGAPEVAAFNRALPLLSRFDATLSEAAELTDVRARLRRGSDAMARAVEAAHRVVAALEATYREFRAELSSEHRQTIDDFIALAEAGPGALLELAVDERSRAHAERAIAAYEALAAVAAAAPRIRAMREYLRATALMPGTAECSAADIADARRDASAADQAIAAAQVECQLVLVALESAVPRWDARGFDALEIRFQKFKWSYIQLYQAAHERWRRESERFAIELGEAREHFAALVRLNSIAALGAPCGDALGTLLEELGHGLARCAVDGPISLEIEPRCPRCGFVLGAALLSAELDEVFEQIRRALRARLAALSHDAIARLIREHDSGHRLDGFLKITQAAQTDALVRVLDDNLARYLERLLEEVQDAAQKEAPGVIQPFARARRGAPCAGKRSER